MHVMVDALIGFCATALILAFFGIPLWVMIVVGWVIGLALGPLTHRLDERQIRDRAAEGAHAPRRLGDDATKG